jgi:hypothetical protein
MYSVNLKKGSARLLRQIGYQGQERNHSSKFCDSTVLDSIKRSAINIRRSMFDVQSFRCSGQAESYTKFHTSAAAGRQRPV